MTLEELRDRIAKACEFTSNSCLFDLEVEFVIHGYEYTIKTNTLDDISISTVKEKVIITLSEGTK